MQIRDQLQRLEHQMAERQLRGHIYLTPDGPIILSTTTTYADRKTGQSVVVGPGPIREALGANASKVIDQVTATTTNRTKAGTGRGVAPVLWNTTCLVVTGTTAAHALIVALYHPGEYDEHELTELARQAPCRNRHELRTAFEDATGVGVPVQSATWLKTVEMISRENPKHSATSTARASQDRTRETLFTQYANELLRDGETPQLGVLVVRGIPRSFNRRPREVQAVILEAAPAITGSKWDGMLAAMAEHLAWLDGHAKPTWVDEEGRFNNPPKAYGPVLRQNGLATPPAAFIRHGALIAGHELDARGGERVQWFAAPDRPVRQGYDREPAYRTQ